MEKYKKYIVGIIGLSLVILFVYYFTNVVIWILVSAFIAMLGNPIVEFIRAIRIKKLRTPRWLASMLTIIFMYGIVYFGIKLITPLVMTQVQEFQNLDIESISEGLEKPIKSIDDYIQKTPILSQPEFSSEDYILEKITATLGLIDIGKLINNLGSTIINLLLSIFVITFTSFFFLKDRDLFDRFIIMLVPEKYEEKTQNALKTLRKLISRYLFGVILEMLLMSILISSGLLILGVNLNLAITIGIIIGVLNIIPYIGPWIGLFIGLILFITANVNLDFNAEIVPMVLMISGIVLIAKLIDDIIFQPIIYSKSVKAHPLEIFFVIIIAGNLYGIIGMALAIPGYTVLRVIAQVFFDEYKFIHQLTQGIDTQNKKSKSKTEKNENI
ncbi:MAG: AI-2E family transporter [Bacteroidales bacterium]|jgi:predicted PurR-regulated permease PerM|nr:AI-2E family transporter [Bacteroidales bacterium]MCK9498794.1 AI-2E family transporter [Bacteroidales bacterium]MDY0315793.1 AI-2E family transporter [Bacteroidales bacterium]NLB86573.1 AI-2E family transporter [Bacteroidales bacterium]